METVINCQPSGKMWKDKPIYTIHLSDGRGGESFSQIAVGTPETDLQIEESQWGLKIKKKPQGGGFQKQRGGNESFALAYAKDLVVAGKVDLKAILSTADKLYAWLEGKKGAAPAQVGAANVPAPQVAKQIPPPVTEKDELPF